MLLFTELFKELDQTTKTSRKIGAVIDYLRQAPAADAAWAIYFLIGRRPKRLVPAGKLADWAAQCADIPRWLFDAGYHTVGDLAETIALVLPNHAESSRVPLHVWVEEHLLRLKDKKEAEQREAVVSAWRQMDRNQRFIWNKLITGGFRVGLSQRLVTRALSGFAGTDAAVIAHRLMGEWSPSAEFFQELISPRRDDADHSRPYPFFLAYPLDQHPHELGDWRDWLIEWKWDGIRAQVIKRRGSVYIWSRGQELLTEKFPELAASAGNLPDGCVLDGEILAWQGGAPLSFGLLQRRIGRKRLTAGILAQVPAALIVYDLLESGGRDIRAHPLLERRALLEQLVSSLPGGRIMLSPVVAAFGWDQMSAAKDRSRERAVEGLMLKRLTSTYQVGRRRGDWWKWKVDPLRIDAVLIYAQTGHGRRSGLYTDYTFGVWAGDELVPFAKAYSGLSDPEIRRVDRFIRTHTIERFGPVRAVSPELVFEIAFEAIQESSRHKSGVAVRFPRIARFRQDKPPGEADTLETVKALLKNPSKPHRESG